MRDGLFSHLQIRVDTVNLAGPSNMAIDELLLKSVQTSALPVLRLYGWDVPSVSLGYFEPWQSAESFALPVTRRWTGGGVVLHGTPLDLTYTLVVPREHPFCLLCPTASYWAIHERLVMILKSVGIDAALHDGPSSMPPGGPCFKKAVPGDVVASVTGEKLAGAGQRRSRVGLMHQGCLRLSEGIPAGLQDRLCEGFSSNCLPLTEAIDESLVQQLIAEKYGNFDWIRRH